MTISQEDIIESARIRYALARPIVREADYLGLLPDYDVPMDEYDFEALIISLSTSADLPIEEMARTVEYVMDYFCGGGSAQSGWSLDVATKLKDAWPKNDLGPDGDIETATELVGKLDIDKHRTGWDQALKGLSTPEGTDITGVTRHFVIRASGFSADNLL